MITLHVHLSMGETHLSYFHQILSICFFVYSLVEHIFSLKMSFFARDSLCAINYVVHIGQNSWQSNSCIRDFICRMLKCGKCANITSIHFSTGTHANNGQWPSLSSYSVSATPTTVDTHFKLRLLLPDLLCARDSDFTRKSTFSSLLWKLTNPLRCMHCFDTCCSHRQTVNRSNDANFTSILRIEM